MQMRQGVMQMRQGKCRSMKMRVFETERTSSPHVDITAYMQPRGGELRDQTALSKDFVA